MKREITMAACVLALIACSKSKHGPNTNPSIKADYQDKVSFLSAAIDTSVNGLQTESSNLSNTEYQFLDEKLGELSQVVVAHGFSLSQALDSQATYWRAWKFDQSLMNIRVDSVQDWRMCSTGSSTAYSSTFRVEVGSFSADAPLTDAGPYYYNSTADYSHLAPNFSISPGTIIPVPDQVSFDSSSCFDRVVLSYSIYSPQTLAAIHGFQAAVADIRSDLAKMSEQNVSNYPVKFSLEQEKAKLQQAFNHLP